MRTGTVIKTGSVYIEQYQLGTQAPGTEIGDRTYFSKTQADIDTALITEAGAEVLDFQAVSYGPVKDGLNVTYPAFDWDSDIPVELEEAVMHKLMRENIDHFPPVVEPVPEPRYKTKMTAEEFARDLLTQEQWGKIEALATTNPAVGAWRDITLAGEVWVGHEDFEAGLQAGIALGAFNQAEVDTIRQGLLIQ